MKRFAALILVFLTLSALPVFNACTKEAQTPGMLTLRVMHFENGPVPWEKVYLATSLENLQAGVYFQEAMTSETGYCKFDTLQPGLYWYDTEHWEDFGAVEVYLNIDSHAVLWVNTPAEPKE